MSAPCVLIVLEDGTSTWVTRIPIAGASPSHVGAILAAGEAAALFIASLQKDAEVVDQHLATPNRTGDH